MSATTVKLDEALLSTIAELKRADQTLSGYVREALLRDARRQQMRKAAETYQALLRDNPTERQMMDEWEAAPLATDPKEKRR
jgi:hypothetical protein